MPASAGIYGQYLGERLHNIKMVECLISDLLSRNGLTNNPYPLTCLYMLGCIISAVQLKEPDIMHAATKII